MTILVVLLALALSWVVGGLLLRAIAGETPLRSELARSEATFLGLGLGLGVSATLFFVASLATDTPAVPSLLGEIAMGICAGVIWWRTRGSGRRRWAEPPVGWGGTWLELALATLFVQLAVLALALSVRAARIEPLGSWDGWAIWNLHARFISRAGRTWAELLSALSLVWSHPDYPYLVPAGVARLWAFVGAEAPWADAAVSLLFGVATVGLLVAAVARKVGAATALVTGIVLVGTPFFVTFASNEHADIPLGFFMLATCVTLVRRGERAAVLTGVFAGLAGAVKNEGLLFGGAVALAMTLRPFWDERVERPWAREVGRFWIGFGAALAPVAAFKWLLAPANDLMASHPWNRIAQLFNGQRHRVILGYLWRQGRSFGEWAYVPLLPVAVALALGKWRQLRRAEWMVGAVLVATMAGYYGVYLLTARDLAYLSWLIDSSLVRLLLQLWIPFLFFWGLVVGRIVAWRSEGFLGSWLNRAIAWTAVNLALAAIVIGAVTSQRAPNELTRTPASGYTRVSVVPGPGWYGLESDKRSVWLWSQGESRLELVASSARTVNLRFALRGLKDQTVTVSLRGLPIWSAQVTPKLTKYQISGLPLGEGATELVFSTDTLGEREGTGLKARTLTFALYNPKL